MGRNEGSSGGAIAVIVIAGVVLVMLVVGALVVLGGFFFLASSSYEPMGGPMTVSTSAPSNAVLAGIIIEADEDGTVLVDGRPLSDDEFRDYLQQHFEDSPEPPEQIAFMFGDSTSAERRAEIHAIYTEVVHQADDAHETEPAHEPATEGETASGD